MRFRENVKNAVCQGLWEGWNGESSVVNGGFFVVKGGESTGPGAVFWFVENWV